MGMKLFGTIDFIVGCHLKNQAFLYYGGRTVDEYTAHRKSPFLAR
jgi:hypothetical protein